MFSVEGVKYTTARHVAERVVDRLAAGSGRRTDRCRTAVTRIDEGEPGGAALDDRIRIAIRKEMAVRLSDLALRRLWPGLPPAPIAESVAAVARTAGAELGWSDGRRDAEIEDVMRQIRTHDSRAGSLA
jgi:glycerol-3-phosphate dehydrogenase